MKKFNLEDSVVGFLMGVIMVTMIGIFIPFVEGAYNYEINQTNIIREVKQIENTKNCIYTIDNGIWFKYKCGWVPGKVLSMDTIEKNDNIKK